MIVKFIFLVLFFSYSLSLKHHFVEKLNKLWKNQNIPNKFIYNNCGSTSDPLIIESISFKPDPIVINKNLTISARVSTNLEIKNGKVVLDIEKKVLGYWTPIPCVDNVGSCTYDNICEIMDQVSNTTCNNPIFRDNNLPCKCPIKADKYYLPPTSFLVQIPDNLSWMADGDFYIKVQMTTNNKRLFCYEFYFSMVSK
jgi:ganglioside GM2 activator